MSFLFAILFGAFSDHMIVMQKNYCACWRENFKSSYCEKFSGRSQGTCEKK